MRKAAAVLLVFLILAGCGTPVPRATPTSPGTGAGESAARQRQPLVQATIAPYDCTDATSQTMAAADQASGRAAGATTSNPACGAPATAWPAVSIPANGEAPETPNTAVRAGITDLPTAVPSESTLTGAASSLPTPWPAAPAPAYWPTSDWRTSTPEAQGMDSAALAGLFDAIRKDHANFFSLLVLRHGYLVAEAYFAPYGPDDRFEIYSCTKAVTSALVGIAIAEGKIPGLDARVMSFFPGRQFANPDPRKDAITILHLLTMTSGLEWPEWGVPYPDRRNPINQIEHSQDWLASVLDRPMVAAPGTTFNYNSGGSHVLSAIVQTATGMPELAYAREHLFGPLGIKDVQWYTDPDGHNIGGWGLQLRPRDMARLGLLYLHEGTWDGQTVVPREWARASVTAHNLAAEGKHYGYQWWIRDFGAYAAEGLNGQYIMVLPAQDTIVVATANITEGSDRVLPDLVREYVMPSVRSDKSLPANPDGAARLAASIEAATTKK